MDPVEPREVQDPGAGDYGVTGENVPLPAPDNYGGPKPRRTPTNEELASQVRTLRIWVLVLTLFLLLTLVASCAVPFSMLMPFGLFASPFGLVRADDPETEPATAICDSVNEAFGGSAPGLTVTEAKQSDPWSDNAAAYVVKYVVPGTDVTMQGTVLDSTELKDSGIVPIMRNGISLPAFGALARVWAQESPNPLGPVHPWVDTSPRLSDDPSSDAMVETPADSTATTVTIDNAEYAAGDLWVAFDGATAVAAGEGTDVGNSVMVRAFEVDVKKGTARFVGWVDREAPFF